MTDIRKQPRFDHHGQIRCGTVSVRDLNASVALYRDYFDLVVIEESVIGAALAASWGLNEMASCRYALLQPMSCAKSYLRLIEIPSVQSIVPATTFGWGAFEISVLDVFFLAERLKGSGFEVVGPPKLVDGFTNFIPMQVVGPDGEVLFLNQVNHSDEHTDLPKANCAVDQIFIVVVASPDREKTVSEHVRFLDLEASATHRLKYSLINRAFDFDPETKQTITMVQKGRDPFAQIDQYPSQATQRYQEDEYLPLACSMVSMMVEDLDSLPIDEVVQGPELRPESALYGGRRVRSIRGSALEFIELIEI